MIEYGMILAVVAVVVVAMLTVVGRNVSDAFCKVGQGLEPGVGCGVAAWASGGNGEFGNGQTGVSSSTPVAASKWTGGEIRQIAGGAYHLAALAADGTVWTWGYNDKGELGDGTSPAGGNSSVPVHVVGPGGTGLLSGITQIAAKGASGNGEFTLALKNDGTVWGWGGQGAYAELGAGPLNAGGNLPSQIAGLSNIRMVAAGAFHGMAIDTSGRVWTWGRNDWGELGNGAFGSPGVGYPGPYQVGGVLTGVNIVSIGAGQSHSFAVAADGTLYAWGYNAECELGNAGGSTSLPAVVTTLSNVSFATGGDLHSIAIQKDGKAWAWGRGDLGQRGDGSTSYSTCTKTNVGANVVSVTAGQEWTSFVKGDGTVWTFGRAAQGELGNNTAPAYATTPQQASNMDKAVAVTGYGYCVWVLIGLPR